MIRFFGKPDKQELESSDSRLRVLEWKVNLLLILVGAQLLITVLTLAKSLLMPSTTTIVIVTILLVVIGWVFRKQIPGLIKRMIAKQLSKEDSDQDSRKSETEGSIR